MRENGRIRRHESEASPRDGNSGLTLQRHAAYLATRSVAALDPAGPDRLNASKRQGALGPRQAHVAAARAQVAAMAPLAGLNSSAVQVQLDADSTSYAQGRGAKALQSGNTIYLRADRFQPGSQESRTTLAHEVIHAAQRRQPAPGAGRSFGAGASLARAERQAHAWAPALAAGQSIGTSLAHLPAQAVAAASEHGEVHGDEADRSLPAGVDWVVEGSNILARSEWVRTRLQQEGLSPDASSLVAPGLIREFIGGLQRAGQFGWVTTAQIDAAMPLLALGGPIAEQGVHEFGVGFSVYHLLGLPPHTPFVWRVGPEEAICLVQTAQLFGADAGAEAVARISAELHERMFQALETLLSQSIPEASWVIIRSVGATELPGLTRSNVGPAVQQRYDRALLEKIFGADAWEDVARDLAEGNLSGQDAAPAQSTEKPRGLRDEDIEFARAMLRELYGSQALAEPEPNASPSGSTGEISAALVAALRQIDQHPTLRAEIMARLRAQLSGTGGDSRSITGRAIREALHRVELEQKFGELGMEAPCQEGDSEHRPVLAEPVRGTIINQSDLLFEGKEGRFVFETRHMADALRVPRTFVRWVVTRQGQPTKHLATGYTQHSDLEKPSAFEYEFKSQGTYDIWAFVSHTYYLPNRHHIPVKVSTRTGRLREVEQRTYEGLDAGTTNSKVHHFETVLVDRLSRAYSTGVRTWGPLPPEFAPPSFETRTAFMARERDQLIAFIAAQEGKTDYESRRLVSYAKDQLETLTEAQARLESERDAGATFFEMRAAYVSNNPGVKSGPLRLVALAKPDADGVQVTIHDYTRLVEPKYFRFGETEDTFEKALEEAFLDLCKAYPSGLMSMRAQGLEPDLKTPKPAWMGFELDCGSTWEDIRTTVFDPAAQLVVNLAGTVIMIFAPVSAPVVFPLLAGYNATDAIGNIVDSAQNGTLTVGSVVGNVFSIGMDLLPFLGRAKRIVHGSERAYYTFEGVRIAGEAVIVTTEALGQIRDLRDQQISQVVELQQEIELLERTNPSHPRLGELHKELKQRIQDVQRVSQRVFTDLVASRAIILVSGTIHTATAPGRPNGRNQPEANGASAGPHASPGPQLPSGADLAPSPARLQNNTPDQQTRMTPAIAPAPASPPVAGRPSAPPGHKVADLPPHDPRRVQASQSAEAVQNRLGAPEHATAQGRRFTDDLTIVADADFDANVRQRLKFENPGISDREVERQVRAAKAFTDYDRKSVFVRESAATGPNGQELLAHEHIHLLAHPNISRPAALHDLNEGITQWLTRRLVPGAKAYREQVGAIDSLEKLVGRQAIEGAYYKGDIDGLRSLVDAKAGQGTFHKFLRDLSDTDRIFAIDNYLRPSP